MRTVAVWGRAHYLSIKKLFETRIPSVRMNSEQSSWQSVALTTLGSLPFEGRAMIFRRYLSHRQIWNSRHVLLTSKVSPLLSTLSTINALTSNKYLLLMIPVRGTWQKSQKSAGAIQYITVHIIIIFIIVMIYTSMLLIIWENFKTLK